MRHHSALHPPSVTHDSSGCSYTSQQASSSSSLSSTADVPPDSSVSNAAAAPCLFAFPLESNFSGARYDPAVVRQIQTTGVTVHSCCEEAEQRSGQASTSHSEEDQQPGQESGSHSEEDQQAEQTLQHQNGAEQRAPKLQTKPAEQGQPYGLQQPQAPATGEEEELRPGQQQSKEEELSNLERSPRPTSSARWHVLIDAAKACTTAPPDLTKNSADFVVGRHLVHPCHVDPILHLCMSCIVKVVTPACVSCILWNRTNSSNSSSSKAGAATIAVVFAYV